MNERNDWCIHAECMWDFLRTLAIVVLVFATVAGLTLLAMWPRAYEAGANDAFPKAFAAAQDELRSEMKQACPCWFNDSRCQRGGAVVACRMPEWMKETGQ